MFLRDIHKENLTLKDANEEQSKSFNELKGTNKDMKTTEKKSFLNNIGLCLSVRKKLLNKFKRKIFPIKNINKMPPPKQSPAPAPEPGQTLEPNQDANQQYLVHLKQQKHKLRNLNIKYLH